MQAPSSEPFSPVKTSNLGRFTLLTMQNSEVSVSFLPEIGAKMISLKSLRTGREFLLAPGRPYRHASLGALFADFDTSGFDDCFPTVAACSYPVGPFAGRRLPDHGELWSKSWRYQTGAAELFFETETASLPCTLRKQVHLDGSAVVLKYEIENTSDTEFSCLWSAHPLLAVERGCRIVLPGEVKEVLIDWSRNDRLGTQGDRCGWPIARTRSGENVDLSVLTSSEMGAADKLFTPSLKEGVCGLQYESGESLFLHFDPLKVPYAGLWICQGGWPTATNGHFTLALEPCTGRPDSLEGAIRSGECVVSGARKKTNWELRIEVASERESR